MYLWGWFDRWYRRQVDRHAEVRTDPDCGGLGPDREVTA